MIQESPGDAPVSSPQLVSSDLRDRFDELTARWQQIGQYASSTHMVAEMPEYQEIIAMGWPAVPLILENLRTDPTVHWLWALREIVGQDPAAGHTTVMGAVSAWLRWGESQELGV